MGANGPFTDLSGSMKQHLGGGRFYSNEEMELLRLQQSVCKRYRVFFLTRAQMGRHCGQ
jgi:hypothetical protein